MMEENNFLKKNNFENLVEISEFLDCLTPSEIIPLLVLNKTLFNRIKDYCTFKLYQTNMSDSIKDSIPGSNDTLKYCHIIDEMVSFFHVSRPLFTNLHGNSIKFNPSKYLFFTINSDSDYLQFTRKDHSDVLKNDNPYVVDVIARKLNVNALHLRSIKIAKDIENLIFENNMDITSYYVTCGYNNTKRDSIIEFKIYNCGNYIAGMSLLDDNDNDNDNCNFPKIKKIEIERVNHACILHNNIIYVAGGDLKGCIQGSRSVLSYDLILRRWKKEPSMFKARTGPGFYLFSDKKSDTIYAVGGDVDSSGQHDINSIEKLIIKENVRDTEEIFKKKISSSYKPEVDWTFVCELPSSRINFKACITSTSNPKLFMFGGYSVNWISDGLILNESTDESEEELMSYEVFDIKNQCFEKTRDIPPHIYQRISPTEILYYSSC